MFPLPLFHRLVRGALLVGAALALVSLGCGKASKQSQPARAPLARHSVLPPTSSMARTSPPPPSPMYAPEVVPREMPMRDMSFAGAVHGDPTKAPGGAVACSITLTGPPERYNPNFQTEAYDSVKENAFLDVTREPLSTFGLDVDTASYANVRRFIMQQGSLPPKDAVRLEELVNYFDYSYDTPKGEHPIAIHTELAACPWAPDHRLLKIGVQGKRYSVGELPARNLVFLVDVSGSMMEPNKLPLVKQGLGYLVDQLRPIDHVAIVVYAGSSGLVLSPTSGAHKEQIRATLDNLQAGGSTQGSAGIRQAYAVARQHFQKGAINRVILATDGDFNVGTTSTGELVQLIEKERASGVFLSVLGFGCGNLRDSMMVKLADSGNGNYAYIDSVQEARKVFGEGGATLVTIAKDVKLQLEFNPAQVGYYRLLGYEKRLLAARDFHDDTKDAGEMGAGHTVTALYELVPPGVPLKAGTIDALKYQQVATTAQAKSRELLTLKCRYKAPDKEQSRLFVQTVEARVTEVPSENFRFAASVAAFAMVLRDSEHKGQASHLMASELAATAIGRDPRGERAEFLSLVKKAKDLKAR